MANTYSSSLRLIIQQDGTNQGTWGGYTNTNIASLIEQAITGVGAITVSGSSDHTLTVTNGASDEARNAVLNVTGTLTGAINVICPTAAKTYIVKNGTTGGYAVTLKTSAGTGVSVPNGSTMQLYCDGTDVVNSISYINGTSTNATNLTGGSAGSIPYQTSAGTTSQLAAGTNGYVLTMSGGLPTWGALPSAGVSSFSAGTTGLTPNTATSGAVTLAGTLAVANGGTGETTATGTGSVVKADSPTFTGTPTAPTAGTGTNTTQVATTAFVNNQIASVGGLGVGQTWQNVTGSRASGTTYTNSTGKPIQINVVIGVSGFSGSYSRSVTVGGVVLASDSTTGQTFVSAIVPTGATYSFIASASGGTAPSATYIFSELR